MNRAQGLLKVWQQNKPILPPSGFGTRPGEYYKCEYSRLNEGRYTDLDHFIQSHYKKYLLLCAWCGELANPLGKWLRTEITPKLKTEN